jgi:hypothetical protein
MWKIYWSQSLHCSHNFKYEQSCMSTDGIKPGKCIHSNYGTNPWSNSSPHI